MKAGIKNFELREYAPQADGGIGRDFKVGDILRLYEPGNPKETIDRVVIYVMTDLDVRHMDAPLAAGWCILGLAVPPSLEFE